MGTAPRDEKMTRAIWVAVAVACLVAYAGAAPRGGNRRGTHLFSSEDIAADQARQQCIENCQAIGSASSTCDRFKQLGPCVVNCYRTKCAPNPVKLLSSFCAWMQEDMQGKMEDTTCEIANFECNMGDACNAYRGNGDQDKEKDSGNDAKVGVVMETGQRWPWPGSSHAFH